MDLRNRNCRNEHTRADAYFRSSWSPDKEWVAFSSDHQTEWKGTVTASALSTSRQPPTVGDQTHLQTIAEPSVVTRRGFFQYCINRLEDRRERKSLHMSRQYGA